MDIWNMRVEGAHEDWEGETVKERKGQSRREEAEGASW
jgi:hypothetical protein